MNLTRFLVRRAGARTHLLRIIIAAVTPLWLFAAYLLVQYAVAERSRFAEDATHVAQLSAVPVEGYLANLVTVATGLSRSPSLSQSNPAAFREEALTWVAGTRRTISVHDGQTDIVNTNVGSTGQRLAVRPLAADERMQLSQGKATVSGVYFDHPTREYRIAVSVPLARDGLVLEINAPTSEVFEVLRPVVPQGWIVGVGDAAGAYVSRSTLHQEVTGTAGLPEYVSKVVGQSGTFTASNFQGTELLAGYYRSPFSHWFYTANIPIDVVQAPMWTSILAIGLSAVAAILVSVALAYIAGNSLAGAAAGLATQARALGENRPIEALETTVEEFDVVSRSLREAQVALAKRTGEVQAVLETAPAAIWVTYDPDARIVIRNRFAAELMGLTDGAQIHFGAPDQIVETVALKKGKVVPRDQRPLSRAMRGEITDNEEFTYIVANGAERVLLSSARPIREQGGAIIGAVQISLDISERKKAWTQRQLLVNELNHRVKNTLAIVQSLASQTLRNAPDLETASRSLGSRLRSLAKTHEILTQEDWSGASLTDLIDGALEPHAGVSRYEMRGDPEWLPPSLALSFSLAFQELTTNAVKYGALSNASGRVLISWEAEGSPTILRLVWREEGGPPVANDGRKGFGSRLLERVFEKRVGRIEVELLPHGLVCTIAAQIEEQIEVAQEEFGSEASA